MTNRVLELSAREARRIAVAAQLLENERPVGLAAVTDRLAMLQLDPTAAVAPSADLVAWSRLGSSYQPTDLKRALEVDRTLFEFNAVVRPIADLGLYLAGASDRPSYERSRSWLRDNDRFRRDILALLGDAGPLVSRDIPDTAVVAWPSSGWTANRNVTQMLEILLARGEVAVSGRVGRERVWDLASRVYPDDVAIPTVAEAERRKNERRLSALGIARATARKMPVEPIDVGETGVAAAVDGVKGEWRVDPAYVDQPFVGRAALLSPFDRLVHDRGRAEELFGFEYTLEMYKPEAKRRWGYYALPILYLDRLVGKLDASVDRTSGVLTVHAVHEDVTFSNRMKAAVRGEIRDLADWLEVDVVGAGRPA
ncbi:MAG: winged helix-turn-helix domain-containing protein [Acidimicrobiia bacterium]|nr:winged helix DNA-binding domain-containing protein [Acidimicrobiia bacterium]NNF10596.1 winged helix-turn-helix domain-containing protein [Acidimicrobiia bacterium]